MVSVVSFAYAALTCTRLFLQNKVIGSISFSQLIRKMGIGLFHSKVDLLYARKLCLWAPCMFIIFILATDAVSAENNFGVIKAWLKKAKSVCNYCTETSCSPEHGTMLCFSVFSRMHIVLHKGLYLLYWTKVSDDNPLSSFFPKPLI